jgi:chemotaxis signal transduction protein
MSFSSYASTDDPQPSLDQLTSPTSGGSSFDSQTKQAPGGAAPLVSLVDRGVEFLVFSCQGIACAAHLTAIREVLVSLPVIASLPDSPPWFLGVFQLRAEILGAADISPMLTGEAPADSAARPPRAAGTAGREHALVVGSGPASLALLVESVGDILRLRQREILLDLVEHPAFGVIAPRYRLGLLAPDGSPTRFVLVMLDTLLADMLSAITDPEVAAYV